MSEPSINRPIDAIEIEVFNNRVLAIIEEMGAKLVRSSFSPNIKERRDCSVALPELTLNQVIPAELTLNQKQTVLFQANC